MDGHEEKRRERAYKIWEDEGRPEGRDYDHWLRAEEQHETTEKQADQSLRDEMAAKKRAEKKNNEA